MFEKYGLMTTQELNAKADSMIAEGKTEEIRAMAAENGIDEDIVEVFIEGAITELCNNMTAAIGKIDVESKDLKTVEIMSDWVEYIKARCFENDAMAAAVRNPKNTLKGCIAKILKWSFENSYDIPEEITKEAGIKIKVKEGIPGMARAKALIKEYYMEG